MSENQKLREALQYVRQILTKPIRIDSHTISCVVAKCDEALALPTAAPVGERELPKLPPPYGLFNINGPDGHRISGFTADQMQAYARAALSAGDAVDAQRWRMSVLIYESALKHPDKRSETENRAFNAYRKAMNSGEGYESCIDAAMRKGQL